MYKLNLRTLISILSLVTTSAVADITEIAVVDKYTNNPISGAIVIKATLGKNSGTKRYECLSLQTGVTDSEGKLNLTNTSPTSFPRKYSDFITSTFGFKHGHRWDMQPTPDNILRFFQDDLPAEMRLDYLSLMLSSSECRSVNNRKDLLLPYFKAIHKEATTLPSSQKSQPVLLKIRRRIATAWSPSDIGNPSKLDRLFENQVKKLLR